MIEAEQAIVIDAAIESVWDYVKDMRRWASLMPGMREFAVVDAHDSRWTLKVGVGGLVRTVNVLVHVDRWDGPERVNFSYKLEGDPVRGDGFYAAARKGAHETEITLKVRVEGTGPMAPMWEAMGKPLMPKFVKSFAEQLKAEIERIAGAPVPPGAIVTAAPSVFVGIGQWLRKFWRVICGIESQKRSDQKVDAP
ncbi:MAG: SRPBCC family protein [Rhodospirillaceae bacterium]|nr:MAG: SRPBCC family protein [Rhodospirillaceae bacterium]